jgi:hypothetical protein
MKLDSNKGKAHAEKLAKKRADRTAKRFPAKVKKDAKSKK